MRWQVVLLSSRLQSRYENGEHWPLLRQYVHQPKGFSRGELVKVTADLCCTGLLLAQHTHRPIWADGETNLSHYVETSDKGPRGRASVLRRRLCGAWRLFGVHTVEEALACQGLWYDVERTLWLQAGRFLCCTEWAVRALLWYVHAHHVQGWDRSWLCLRWWMIQWTRDLCVSQVREEWTGTATSQSQKT